jgi:hypothetical protein
MHPAPSKIISSSQTNVEDAGTRKGFWFSWGASCNPSFMIACYEECGEEHEVGKRE